MGITGYGVCTWLFGNRPLSDIASRVQSLGYDGVELLGNLDQEKPHEVRRILSSLGLVTFSLTPLDVDLAHPDDSIRRYAFDYYLALLDFAAELQAPMISCHGAVGRIRPLATWDAEWQLLIEAVRAIGERAQALHLQVGLELLNRYESHLLNTVEQGLRFLDQVALSNVGLHLDTFHMNIEEPNLPGAIGAADARLFLFHAADSNRQAIGRGHTDFAALIRSLSQVHYSGPIVLECPAPGPDPFQAIKDDSSVPWVETFLRESLPRLRALVAAA